jgi:phage-related protein
VSTGQHESPLKPIVWVASSKGELSEFPGPVRREMGYALYLAQLGMKAKKAKPLKGFGGAGVLEVISDHVGNTFRAVYTVKLAGFVFVLHAFEKKSRKGISTPKMDIDLIKKRLKIAADYYKKVQGKKSP